MQLDDDQANQPHADIHQCLQNIHVVEVCMLLIVLTDRLTEFMCVKKCQVDAKEGVPLT